MSENITAAPTKDGAVLLTIIDSKKKRAQVTLPTEAVQKLKAQIEVALVMARVRQRTSGLL